MAKAQKKKSGSPAWMATFADMSTLLLTFFVIMLSMANIDVQSFKELLGSVHNAFGVQLEQTGVFQAADPKEIDTSNLKPGEGEWETKKEDTLISDSQAAKMIQEEEQTAQQIEAAKVAEAEKAERQEMAKDIKEAVDQAQLGDQVEVNAGSQGVRIRVEGTLMFDPGSADLKPSAYPFLENLVQVLQKFDYFVLVEGHTDSQPISTPRFPSNWELSGDRASAVLRFLITWGVEAARLTAVGLADNFPLAANDTAEGRSKNRRVEFILTKQSFRPEID